MYKAEVNALNEIVITHCGEVVRRGFRWLCQAEEVAEELNVERGYEEE